MLARAYLMEARMLGGAYLGMLGGAYLGAKLSWTPKQESFTAWCFLGRQAAALNNDILSVQSRRPLTRQLVSQGLVLAPTGPVQIAKPSLMEWEQQLRRRWQVGNISREFFSHQVRANEG